MKKNNPIKVTVINPPTKEQADKRIKELSAYLEKIWKKPQITKWIYPVITTSYKTLPKNIWFSCGRPHCDVCGWTEVSLLPLPVMANVECPSTFKTGFYRSCRKSLTICLKVYFDKDTFCIPTDGSHGGSIYVACRKTAARISYLKYWIFNFQNLRAANPFSSNNR